MEKSNVTENELWKIINHTRFEGKKKEAIENHSKYGSRNLNKLSSFLGIKTNLDEVNEEFSKTTKKSLREMFFTLIERPSYFEKLYRKFCFHIFVRMRSDQQYLSSIPAVF